MILIKSKQSDILIKDDKVIKIAERTQGDGSPVSSVNNIGTEDTAEPSPCVPRVIDVSDLVVVPGLVDIHVHFREPGFEYKEDILTGSEAAAAGGVTTCCCMPNTSPVADSKEVLEIITEKAKQAAVTVLPIGAVTMGQKGKELTDFAALKKAGAVALSDDGLPIRNDEIMRKALQEAKKNDILIISHCEEEEPMVERDVKLAAETDAKIHIAHVSTAYAVETIRKAKAAGVKVTAETCPHYFSLTEEKVKEKGTNAKMSPPLRKQKDVEAIIEGLIDGTIDAIATDHAPHSAEEKALLLNEAPNGIIGLETSLAVALTYLYHTGKLSLAKILSLMSKNPADILSINDGSLKEGETADIIIFDPNEEWTVDKKNFKSKSINTPYDGMKLKGKIKYTISRGKIVYNA